MSTTEPKKRSYNRFTLAECRKKYAHLLKDPRARLYRDRPKGYIGISYKQDWLHHREDGPAYIQFHHNGLIRIIQYMQHGDLHRVDGPAYVYFNNHGKRGRVEYFQNGRHHREDGPAVSSIGNISGKRTFGYYIHGVEVPRDVVLYPAKQNIQDVVDEPNMEIARIRIERYGWDRYLKEVGAKVVDERTDDISGTEERLLRCLVSVSRLPQLFLLCSCPSTARVYPVQVPTGIKNCADAQKWLKGRRLRKTRIIGAS